MVPLVSAPRWRLCLGAGLRSASSSRLAALVLLVAAVLAAACGAKVKPPIFEEDDPRAARAEAMEPGQPAEPAQAIALIAPTGSAKSMEPADPAGAPGDGRAAATSGRAMAAPPVTSARPRPLAPPGVHPRTGSIDRTALVRVLDAGPGGLLRAIEVSPFFEGSRFLGWRLDQIVDAASPLADVDLAAGDIILAVNHRPIARPEHVMAIWQDLRAADELICQVWRGAAAFELRFAITPRATPQQAAPPPPPARPVTPPVRAAAPSTSSAPRR